VLSTDLDLFWSSVGMLFMSGKSLFSSDLSVTARGSCIGGWG